MDDIKPEIDWEKAVEGYVGKNEMRLFIKRKQNIKKCKYQGKTGPDLNENNHLYSKTMSKANVEG